MTVRRKNGGGGVQQVESGGFRWRITQDVGGKLVRVSGPVVETRAEAEAGLLQARAARDRGTLPPPDRMKLGQWLDYWRDIHSPTVASSTAAQIREYLQTYVTEQYRGMPIRSVKTRDLRQLDADMIKKSLPAGTRRKLIGIVRQALRHAVEDEVISADPGINVRIKNSVVDDLKAGDKKRALPPAEARRLMEAVAHHDLEIMVRLLFSLGLRRGEALGVRWQDVDFRAGTVSVNQQIRMSGNVAEIVPFLKTTDPEDVEVPARGPGTAAGASGRLEEGVRECLD